MPDAPLPSEQHKFMGLERLSEARLHQRRESVFLVFAGLFLGSLTMLNILGITRFIKLYELDTDGDPLTKPLLFAVAVGVLPYPITFLCTDFISEFWGRARANWVVFIGFLLNLWVILILWIGGALPGLEQIDPVTGQMVRDAAGRLPVFFEVRTLAFGAVAASMIAYLAAQLIDVQLFHFWKNLTRGKHLWLRNNGSTLVSQLVDTVAVILITHFYAHALPIDDAEPLTRQLVLFIFTGYAFKVVAALFDTVPFYLGSKWLCRYLRLPPPGHAPHPPAGAAAEAGVG